MATFTRVKVKHASCGRMLGALSYVLQFKKVTFDGVRVETGHNCTPYTSYLEMMATKQSFKKTDGVSFLHYVHSFSDKENITPWQANEIARELAERLFPDSECVIATHNDTDNLHSHIIVNTVSFKDGKKLHMSPTSLQEQRQVNDEICKAHGFFVLEPYDGQKRNKRLTPGEYRAAMRGESWKFRLMKAIDEALEYSHTRKDFIANMEYEGYEVRWDDAHKYILFTTPEGQKCRDRTLHDDTYLKENLEKLFTYRAEHGFTPQTPEPPEGWLAQANTIDKLVSDAVRLGKSIEKMADVPPASQPFTPAESKQKKREALKKLAQGHKLQNEQEQEIGQKM
ncbi:MAG TPA: relaxase/mobilization nuclease domain-containing protein [Candidatus Acidoferrum sp.]|nr:relaxase/mobilization nuclease domain-containing protein [Candidatus Acidoferrum sp.]